MADFEVWSVFWFLCVMCVAPVKMHCQLVKVYEARVIPWKQADTVHGFQQWQDRCWHVVTWAPSMSTTDDMWHTDTFSCWCSLGSAQNCLWPTGLQRSVCTLGGKESHIWWQSSLYGTEWAYLVSIVHVTLIKEQFWSWNMVNYTKPETRKRMCDRETYHLPPAKKMEALSSVKMTVENCLGTINMCLFWISLTMVTLCWLL